MFPSISVLATLYLATLIKSVGSHQTWASGGPGQGLRWSGQEEGEGMGPSGFAYAQCPFHPRCVSVPRAAPSCCTCPHMDISESWEVPVESTLQCSPKACSVPVTCQDLGGSIDGKAGLVF